MPVYPTFEYEQRLWSEGLNYVIGIDEVGRGAVAGPVCVAGAIFPVNFDKTREYSELKEVRDSKTIAKRKRERLSHLIKKHAISYSVAYSSAKDIDELGIREAANNAALRVIKELTKDMNGTFILADVSLLLPNSSLRYEEITGGDKKSFTIAAASILAKVARDAHMTELSEKPQYSQYDWANSVGYGTKKHMAAISEFGLSDEHRRSFLKNITDKQ